jgi:chromosome segregation ATPase
MKKLLYVIVYFFATMLFISSCQNMQGDANDEVVALREKLAQQSEFIKTIANEKRKINDLISDALKQKDGLMTEERVSKLDAEEKIEGLLAIITRGEQRINALEKELKNKNVEGIGDLVSPEIKELRTRLTNMNIELRRLQEVIREKDDTILNLKDENAKLNEVLQEKDSQIGGLEIDRGRLRSEVEQLNALKFELEGQQNQLKEKMANEYYKMGVDWQDAASEARGRGRKDKRREYTRKAIESYEKAQDLGHVQAAQMISLLKADVD